MRLFDPLQACDSKLICVRTRGCASQLVQDQPCNYVCCHFVLPFYAIFVLPFCAAIRTYWAAGTGYGTGARSNTTWDPKKAEAAQQVHACTCVCVFVSMHAVCVCACFCVCDCACVYLCMRVYV